MTAPSLLWCFRKIVLRRNQLLCLLMIFGFCYFLMRPVDVIDPEDYPFNDLDLEGNGVALSDICVPHY